MLITPIPCLDDNYAYIICDNLSKSVGVVDPSEADPIINYLENKDLKLSYIFNTHHHFDHVGGNSLLKKKYGAKVIGYEGDKHRIPEIDLGLKDKEKFILQILHIPGHTLGHICFFFEKEKIAFTGDTLFSLGCGRIFEGDHKQMLSSLNKIKKLPTVLIIPHIQNLARINHISAECALCKSYAIVDSSKPIRISVHIFGNVFGGLWF